MELLSCAGSVLPKIASICAGCYGIFVLHGFWTKKFTPHGPAIAEMSTPGKVHILIWTIGPPIWFFIEYWVASTFACPNDKDALANVKLWEDTAKTFWAGILAAAIFLKGK